MLFLSTHSEILFETTIHQFRGFETFILVDASDGMKNNWLTRKKDTEVYRERIPPHMDPIPEIHFQFSIPTEAPRQELTNHDHRVYSQHHGKIQLD